MLADKSNLSFRTTLNQNLVTERILLELFFRSRELSLVERGVPFAVLPSHRGSSCRSWRMVHPNSHHLPNLYRLGDGCDHSELKKMFDFDCFIEINQTNKQTNF